MLAILRAAKSLSWATCDYSSLLPMPPIPQLKCCPQPLLSPCRTHPADWTHLIKEKMRAGFNSCPATPYLWWHLAGLFLNHWLCSSSSPPPPSKLSLSDPTKTQSSYKYKLSRSTLPLWPSLAILKTPNPITPSSYLKYKLSGSLLPL